MNFTNNDRIPTSGDEWVEFLLAGTADANVVFSENNGWEMLNRTHWMKLLSSNFNFSQLDGFNWQALNGADWISLMSADKRYVKICSEEAGWDMIDTKSLRAFIKKFPEYEAEYWYFRHVFERDDSLSVVRLLAAKINNATGGDVIYTTCVILLCISAILAILIGGIFAILIGGILQSLLVVVFMFFSFLLYNYGLMCISVKENRLLLVPLQLRGFVCCIIWPLLFLYLFLSYGLPLFFGLK